MRKTFLSCVLLAGISLFAGCQKEQNTVTLQAVIDQNTKAYIGTGNYPYWDSDDEVKVNGTPYNITISQQNGTVATISDVPISEAYCAIYPSDHALSMDITSTTTATARIDFWPHQDYIVQSGHQRVDMPMAAIIPHNNDGDNRLVFKNLCSIIRVNVTKPSNAAYQGGFDVKHIAISASGSYIAGVGNASITANSVTLEMPTIQGNSNNAVTLSEPNVNSNMGTISEGHPGSFDIIVPPITNSTVLTFHVEATDGRFYEHQATVANLGINKIAPITLSVNQLNQPDKAYLVSGEIFYRNLRRHFPGIDINYTATTDQTGLSITSISLINGISSFQGDTVHFETEDSPRDIVGHVVYVEGRRTLQISADISGNGFIYFNQSCKDMFRDLRISSLGINVALINTEWVTDMSYMFAGCRNLASPQGLLTSPRFNTANVRTMAHMFDGCRNIGSGGDNMGLNLSTFNTHHLDGNGMVAMFKDCSNIQSLNLSSFTTEQITDMSDLFRDCSLLKTLRIDNFTISSGTTLTDMFNNLNSYGNTDNPCAIYCGIDAYNAIHATGANTGIDESKVSWPNQSNLE